MFSDVDRKYWMFGDERSSTDTGECEWHVFCVARIYKPSGVRVYFALDSVFLDATNNK